MDKECRDITWYDSDKKEYTVGTCDTSKKVCKGSATGDKCKDHLSCVAGSYCSSNICTAQVESGKACESTYDCKNNLFCYKKVCTEVYSLDVGTSLVDTDDEGKRIACKTNLYSYDTEPKCQEKRYKLAVNQKNDSGIISCDIGSKCTYQIFESSAADAKAVGNDTTEECVCGYDDSETGYCPYSQSATDFTLKLVYHLKALLDNKRHTVNRSLGNQVKTEAEKCYEIDQIVNFAKAPKCVLETLGLKGCSSNYYLTSIFLLMIILSLL